MRSRCSGVGGGSVARACGGDPGGGGCECVKRPRYAACTWRVCEHTGFGVKMHIFSVLGGDVLLCVHMLVTGGEGGAVLGCCARSELLQVGSERGGGRCLCVKLAS
jgi:hypothetical protein